MDNIVRQSFKVYPEEMTYHKDRFLQNEAGCEVVTFVGAFHGDTVLTNEIEVIARGVEVGKVARFLVRCGDQETHLDMDLTTCRYEAESNIKTKLGDVVLEFTAHYRVEQKEAA
ncbi:hypothetical protein D9M71_712430 [compost metagenome]